MPESPNMATRGLQHMDFRGPFGFPFQAGKRCPEKHTPICCVMLGETPTMTPSLKDLSSSSGNYPLIPTSCPDFTTRARPGLWNARRHSFNDSVAVQLVWTGGTTGVGFHVHEGGKIGCPLGATSARLRASNKRGSWKQGVVVLFLETPSVQKTSCKSVEGSFPTRNHAPPSTEGEIVLAGCTQCQFAGHTQPGDSKLDPSHLPSRQGLVQLLKKRNGAGATLLRKRSRQSSGRVPGRSHFQWDAVLCWWTNRLETQKPLLEESLRGEKRTSDICTRTGVVWQYNRKMWEAAENGWGGPFQIQKPML